MSEKPGTNMEEGRDASERNGQQQQQQQQQQSMPPPNSWNSFWFKPPPPVESYPPISSIPKTTPERLALAATEESSASAKTILYLAYGSNLAAQTFLGARGIRPLSQINVSAPAFELTFDLPGLAYSEPCFANTRPRKIPEPSLPGLLPPPPPPDNADQPTWTKGLYGVVYEVTPEDYATIIKTEGGGQGYHDVLTPCFELSSAQIPGGAPILPEIPKPFLAHTLYAPSLPDTGNKKSWKLFQPARRPNPDYAQASLRYLNLIRDGAREHDLPADYRTYLARLRTYAVTSTRQRIGRVLFSLVVLPWVVIMLTGSRLFADDKGVAPRWLGVITNVYSNIAWMAYDKIFKPIFGDGEHTEPGDEDKDKRNGSRGLINNMVRKRYMADGTDGEKTKLLDDW
ncbi:hypothetical protein GGR50DRAFT_649070 [Xylaria sp. CBS 124048]|nr:hypothetical protein GGR50DRAFT_649070 [Xylaria sp. CBS 124048]